MELTLKTLIQTIVEFSSHSLELFKSQIIKNEEKNHLTFEHSRID